MLIDDASVEGDGEGGDTISFASTPGLKELTCNSTRNKLRMWIPNKASKIKPPTPNSRSVPQPTNPQVFKIRSKPVSTDRFDSLTNALYSLGEDENNFH